MKILTAAFLIYYIYLLFNQGGFIGTSLLNLLKLLPSDSLQKDMYQLESPDNEIKAQSNRSILACFIYLIVIIVEFIYVIKATAYGHIAVAYLIFWMFVFVYSKLSSRHKNKTKANMTVQEAIDVLSKFSIKQFIINLVDVAYFSYMFWMLFLV